MIAHAKQLTASGQIEGGRVYVVGGAMTGVTEIKLYDGDPGASGKLVAVMSGEGEHHFGYEIICENGLWATITGAGTGVVWLV